MKYLTVLSIVIILTSAQLTPLAGSSFLCTTFDPLTLTQGSNICMLVNNGTCISPDGKWYIPCGITVNPILTTNLDMHSYSYTKSTDYNFDGTDKVDFSASAGFGKFSAKASYSSASENYIQTTSNDDVTFVASEVEMKLYSITTNMMTAPLGPEFTDYINVLSSKLAVNDTTGYVYWLGEFISNIKYAVVTQVITGGRLMQKQYVKNTYYQNTDKTTIENSASASASFGSLFSAQASRNWGVTTSDVNTFKSASSDISSYSIGGPYIQGMIIPQWQTNVESNPGILGYTLSKTSFWINSNFFPVLPPIHVQKIYNDYEFYWTSYINNNSYLGCTDQLAINFTLTATVDTPTCVYDFVTGSTFGGIFITSHPESGNENCVGGNGLMKHNECACPTGSTMTCTFSGFFGEAFQVCTCYAPIGQRNFPAFGGAYSSTTANPITGLANCPNGTQPMNNGVITICVGNVSDASYNYGGTYYNNPSGCVTNPYTSACTCAPDAQNTIKFTISQNGLPPIEMYVCYGQKQYITNDNPGTFPTLKQMILPDGSTGIQEPTNNHSMVFIIVSVIAGCVLLAIVGMLVYYSRLNKPEYVRIE